MTNPVMSVSSSSSSSSSSSGALACVLRPVTRGEASDRESAAESKEGDPFGGPFTAGDHSNRSVSAMRAIDSWRWRYTGELSPVPLFAPGMQWELAQELAKKNLAGFGIGEEEFLGKVRRILPRSLCIS